MFLKNCESLQAQDVREHRVINEYLADGSSRTEDELWTQTGLHPAEITHLPS